MFSLPRGECLVSLSSIEEIVEEITQEAIPSHVKSLTFDICVEDETGEDVEVPYVRYLL